MAHVADIENGSVRVAAGGRAAGRPGQLAGRLHAAFAALELVGGRRARPARHFARSQNRPFVRRMHPEGKQTIAD